jgi:hypothetical protein
VLGLLAGTDFCHGGGDFATLDPIGQDVDQPIRRLGAAVKGKAETACPCRLLWSARCRESKSI